MSNSWPKIWGKNEEIFRNSAVSVNVLHLIRGGTCSYHRHRAKANLFRVISGKLRIHTEHGVHELGPDGTLFIPAGLKHQFEAVEESKVIEVMYVEYDAEDIERETKGFVQDYDGKKNLGIRR